MVILKESPNATRGFQDHGKGSKSIDRNPESHLQIVFNRDERSAHQY
jgi:hypothetical protein